MKLFGADVVLPQKKQIATLGLIIAVGVALVLFVWRESSRREQSRAENLAFLHSIRADSITGVTVFDSHDKLLKIVTDSRALSALADALRSTAVYEPNHPSYTHDFLAQLSLKDGTSRLYQWHRLFGDDGTIYIDFSGGGNAKSTSLYRWMTEQSLL